MNLSRNEIIHLYEVLMRNPEASNVNVTQRADSYEIFIELRYALMTTQPIPFEPNIFRPQDENTLKRC